MLAITDANFEQEVLNGDKPAVVDFWATWCGTCRTIAPYIEELANEYEGKVTIGKMDVDSNSEVPTKYGIRNIPTVLFFKNGQLIDKHVGAAPKSTFETKVKALL